MNWQKLKNQDWFITILALVLSVLGLLVIYSTTYNATTSALGAGSLPKQVVFLIFGLICYFFLTTLDFSWIENRGVLNVLYAIIILLLIYVKFFGVTIAGTNRWINIGFFSLQPSEYAKIIIILITAQIFSDTRNHNLPVTGSSKQRSRFSGTFLDKLGSFKPILINALYVIPIVVLTLIQPSLGNALISLLLWLLIIIVLFPHPAALFKSLALLVMSTGVILQFFNISMENNFININYATSPNFLVAFLLLAGIVAVYLLTKTKLLTILLLAIFTIIMIFGSLVIWNKVITNYQKERVITFLQGPESDPSGAGYQVIQSRIAIGSGRLEGRGFLQGTQSSLNVLTQSYTDFVFAAFAEQFGFIGAGILLLLYLALILRIIKTGTETKSDFGRYLALGVAILLLLHVFINIGMNLGKLPVTGIPLPLVSYGGSSVLMTMICLGLVQSINSGKKSVDIADNLMLTSRSLIIK
jgi:rod shape determining protein RodA